MAKTNIQQSQISGSLVASVDDSASLVKAPGSLLGDLNVLRTQVKNILGEANFYTAPSQDLHAIRTAMSASGADAYFQGDIYAANGAFTADLSAVNATLSGDLSAVKGVFSGDLTGSMGFKVLGASDLVGAVTMESSLSVAGRSDLAGALHVGGDLDVSGSALFAGPVEIAGSGLEMTGSFAVKGDSALDGALSVSGKADFAGIVDVAGTLSASAVKIDGATAQRLYIVDSDGSMKDEAKMTFDGSQLWINGDLEVAGGDVTLSHGVSMSSSTTNRLVITASDVVEVSGDLQVGGNDIKDSNGDIVVTMAGNGSKKITFAADAEAMGDFFAVNAAFSGDVTVAGDLAVKGAMTYIETTNLKVKDAIIHLATGSNSAASRGIVLHGNSVGGEGDLAVGAKINGYDFIFAKNVSDSDVDAGNSEIFSTADLAGAWMSSVKLGLAEGALSGSLAVDGSNVKLSAEADLKLSANGDTVSLMAAADYSAVFGLGGWAQGETLVGALETLYQGASGGAKKGNLSSSNVSGNTLTFGPLGGNIGTLNSADQRFIDVYLNGVLLAYGVDVSSVTTTTIDLEASIASALTADDVITVVLRGAA